MRIDGKEYMVQDVSRVLTVPDCNVLGPNKTGKGNGEAKFYFGSKLALESFTLGQRTLECFFLKKDLMTFMLTAKKEYKSPTQNYAEKDKMPQLWENRIQNISQLPEMICFTVDIQSQIQGDRGYINSKESAYKLFRTLSLPNISYISIMRLQTPSGKTVFYWRLFVDFEAIVQRGITPQALIYGRKRNTETKTVKRREDAPQKNVRNSSAQSNYRNQLLDECPYCPITKISDERLLVASHIKPCAVSDESEAFDPMNGFILSPLYDRLFDQGFISFDEKKCMMVSNWISPTNQERCRIKEGTFFQELPLRSEREVYMRYHRQFVFKG